MTKLFLTVICLRFAYFLCLKIKLLLPLQLVENINTKIHEDSSRNVEPFKKIKFMRKKCQVMALFPETVFIKQLRINVVIERRDED